MQKAIFIIGCVFLLLFAILNTSVVFAADEESLAQQAEQSGKLRDAVTHYVSALQSASEGRSKDQQLREKIISLVQKLTPPPAVPEEAQKYLGRGQAAVEIAKTQDDFLAAISEFKKAARLAPEQKKGTVLFSFFLTFLWSPFWLYYGFYFIFSGCLV